MSTNIPYSERWSPYRFRSVFSFSRFPTCQCRWGESGQGQSTVVPNFLVSKTFATSFLSLKYIVGVAFGTPMQRCSGIMRLGECIKRPKAHTQPSAYTGKYFHMRIFLSYWRQAKPTLSSVLCISASKSCTSLSDAAILRFVWSSSLYVELVW